MPHPNTNARSVLRLSEITSSVDVRAAAALSQDRAADICAKLGLTSTGKLKVDVDALCEATNVPFTLV